VLLILTSIALGKVKTFYFPAWRENDSKQKSICCNVSSEDKISNKKMIIVVDFFVSWKILHTSTISSPLMYDIISIYKSHYNWKL